MLGGKNMRILFVCTGNTCRSPMAEGILKKILKDSHENIFCESAGLATLNGLAVSSHSAEACDEIGVDISQHTSQSIKNVNLDSYDYVVTFTDEHASALVSLGVKPDRVYTLDNIRDPFGMDVETYKKCRDDIKLGVEKFYKEMICK